MQIWRRRLIFLSLLGSVWDSNEISVFPFLITYICSFFSYFFSFPMFLLPEITSRLTRFTTTPATFPPFKLDIYRFSLIFHSQKIGGNSKHRLSGFTCDTFVASSSNWPLGINFLKTGKQTFCDKNVRPYYLLLIRNYRTRINKDWKFKHPFEICHAWKVVRF